MAHLVLDVDGADQVFQLRGLTTIGRHPNNDVQVLDALVSKRHCEIVHRNGEYVLRDLGTLNGSYLNDVRVRGEAKLTHRDIIRIGGSYLWFSDLDEALAEPRPAALPARGPVSAEQRTEMGLADAERAAMVRAQLETLLDVGRLEDLPRKLLTGVIVVAQADGGMLVEPRDLGVQIWSGRGREILERDYFRELAERAVKDRAVVWQTHTRDLAYRVWQPRYTVIAPVTFVGSVYTLAAVEADGSEPLDVRDLELYSRVAGAVWAALS